MTKPFAWPMAGLLLALVASAGRADIIPWTYRTQGGEVPVEWKIWGDVAGPQVPGKAFLVLGGVGSTPEAGTRDGVSLGGLALQVDEPGSATISNDTAGQVCLSLTVTDSESGQSASVGLSYNLFLQGGPDGAPVAHLADPTSAFVERVLGRYRYHITVNDLRANVSVSPAVEPNPEPSTLAIAGLGLAAVFVSRRLRAGARGSRSPGRYPGR